MSASQFKLMRRLACSLLLLVPLACKQGKGGTDASPESSTAPKPAEATGKATTAARPSEAVSEMPIEAKQRLEAFGKSLGCEAKGAEVEKLWCLAVNYPAGRAPDAPPPPVLFGVSIALRKGTDAKEAVKRFHAVALSFGGAGKALQGQVAQIKPTEPGEKKKLLESTDNLLSVLAGKTPDFKLPKDLSLYLRSLKPKHAVAQNEAEWIIRGKNTSYLRRVGARAWVSVEVPEGKELIWISLLSDGAKLSE